MQPRYIFDFDRTVFDTHSFFEDLLEILAQEYHISSKQMYSEIHNFRDIDGNNYDFFKHLRSYIGKDPDEIENKIKQKLEKNYLYPDAKNIFSNGVYETGILILTIGEPKYQRLKITVAGLDNFPTEIIPQAKINYIAQKWPNPTNEIILVDDKASTYDSEIPRGIKAYQIIRSKDQEITVNPRVEIIRSLQEIL